MKRSRWLVLSGTIGFMLCVALLMGCSSTSVSLGSAGETASEKLRVAPLDTTGSSGSFRSLRSTAATGSLPKKLHVYRVVPANVTKSWVAGRASKLGMSGAVADDGIRLSVGSARASFEVDKQTGSFDYTTTAFTEQTTALTTLLTDAEYRTIAETFLEDAGLMHAQAEFRDVNRDNVVADYVNGQWLERPYFIEVRFSHKPLDGIAFDQGVGPKIIVQIGEGGTVLGAMSVWREVERAGTYSLEAIDAAVGKAQRGNAQLFDVSENVDGTIDEIGVSYLNEPLGYNQLYVLPSYVMRGRDMAGRRFTAIVRAIQDADLIVDPQLNPGPAAPLSTGPKE